MNIKKLESRLFIFLVFCLPFNLGALYTHLVETDMVLAFDVLLGVLYVLWFINSNGFVKPRFFWGRIALPFTLFLIWTLISAAAALSLTMLGAGVYMMLKAFLLYLYVVNNVRTKADLHKVFIWFCVGLCFHGFLGIVQYTTGSSLGLGFLGAISKTRLAGVTRVRGTFGLPNRFGAWLALLVPIASCLFLFEIKPRMKMFYGAATFLGIVALLLSFSRSAWAGLLGSGGLLIYLLARHRMLKPKYVVGIIAVMIVIAGLVGGFWDTIMLRFETGATGKYRLVMIDIAFDLIKENFLIGVGLMNYRFHQIEHFRFWQPVHNTYLRLAAEIGIPGLILFLTIIITSMREAYRMLKSKDRFLFASALGLIGSMWAFLFTIQFGPEYHHYRIKILFWFILGLIFSLRNVNKHTLYMQKMRQQKLRTDTDKPLSGHKAPVMNEAEP
ncbi:O-antigen ligase family protein [bacterium]|nr:O-antigen ligase family protein [bacterium]